MACNRTIYDRGILSRLEPPPQMLFNLAGCLEEHVGAALAATNLIPEGEKHLENIGVKHVQRLGTQQC